MFGFLNVKNVKKNIISTENPIYHLSIFICSFALKCDSSYTIGKTCWAQIVIV